MEKIIQIFYKNKKQSNDHTAWLRIYHISPWPPQSIINSQSESCQHSSGYLSANCEDANICFDLNVNVETYEILLSGLYFS